VEARQDIEESRRGNNRGNEKWNDNSRMPWPEWYFDQALIAYRRKRDVDEVAKFPRLPRFQPGE
jgi:hypothetical protein